MKVIALDIGTKRIGVAATDPLCLFAQPVTVIERHGGEKDAEAIARICREQEAGLLLIGIPLNEEGMVGPQAKKVQGFAGRLREYFRSQGDALSIEFWDERYSTAVAEERLIGADMSRLKRKRVIDKMAAVVILEDYLRSKS